MDNPEKTEGAIKNGQSRENRRGNQEWTIQRKQKGQSRMDNPEKRKLEMFPKIETKHTRRPLVI
jgi:ERCC4-type nuclease